MQNRPFSAINSNVFEQKFQNSAPASLNGQNVILAQDGHQRVFNAVTTSIAGVQGPSMNCYPYMQPNGFPMQPPVTDPVFLHQQNRPNAVNFHCLSMQPSGMNPGLPVPYQQSHPNGVTFTFNNPPQPHYAPNPFTSFNNSVPNSNQPQGFNPVELMHPQHQVNQPYSMKLHLDRYSQTSNADLVKLEGETIDADKEDTSDKKKVTFCDNKDSETQCWLCCNTCNQEEEPKKSPRTKKKRRGRSKDRSSSDQSSDEECDKR